MSELAQKQCIPCSGDVPSLKGEDLAELRAKLGGGWDVVDEHHLKKAFDFKDFKAALAFTNCVGERAEAEGHHPDIQLSYGRVVIEVHTHAIDGLSESDFVLAAKIDADCAPASSEN